MGNGVMHIAWAIAGGSVVIFRSGDFCGNDLSTHETDGNQTLEEPGATGAPAYSAHIVRKIFEEGFISRKNTSAESSPKISWDFETASDL